MTSRRRAGASGLPATVSSRSMLQRRCCRPQTSRLAVASGHRTAIAACRQSSRLRNIAGFPRVGPGMAAPGFPPVARPVARSSRRVWRDSPAGPIEGRAGAEYLAEAGQAPLPGCRGIGGQAMRNRAPALGVALLLGVTVGLLGLSASAPGSAASALAVKPKPSPSPSPAPSGTFVKAYTALVNGSQLNLTPLDVQATSDGGYVALAETQSAAGLGVDWLVKLSATGVPQWQEQVGCASPQGAPGDYADGVSVQQTVDGGYVVAGGTIDCGSGSSCPPLSGRSCALVEKLDPAGRLTWARAYAAGPDGSALSQIRQAADGGYIAAGSFTDASQNTGALLLKLDSAGNVQWQKDLGPTS